jgi:hypothetical protein
MPALANYPCDTDIAGSPSSTRLTVIGNSIECLTDFFRDDVNMAVWEREIDPLCLQFAESFAQQAGELKRFISIEADETADDILPNWARTLPGTDRWLADINTVIDMFRCLFEPAAVGVRLHVLNGTMCPRFHVDRVPARLLVTYSGKGTEWLSEDQVIRTCGDARLPEQNIRPEDIQSISTAAVALLKGELWEGNEGFGLAHRSPSPEGAPRLVLALDWL